MAKSKKISTEALCRLAEEYQKSNAGTKITIPALGKFIRNQGYDIGDHLIRRDAGVREYIEKYNQEIAKEADGIAIVYHGLDVEAFLQHNKSYNQLKEALVTRDNYYAAVVEKAAEIQKKNQKLEQENKRQRDECQKAQEELEKRKSMGKDSSADMKEKNETIRKLRDIIYSRVYPEMANLILQKEGIFDAVNQVIIPESIESMTISAKTDVRPFRYDAVNELLKDCDE